MTHVTSPTPPRGTGLVGDEGTRGLGTNIVRSGNR
jgi:hypothetical protein